VGLAKDVKHDGKVRAGPQLMERWDARPMFCSKLPLQFGLQLVRIRRNNKASQHATHCGALTSHAPAAIRTRDLWLRRPVQTLVGVRGRQ
jgi:hypothetical protein